MAERWWVEGCERGGEDASGEDASTEDEWTAYVEEPVGLVEDEHLDLVKREAHGVRDVVDKAAGRRDHHVRPETELGLLGLKDVDQAASDCQHPISIRWGFVGGWWVTRMVVVGWAVGITSDCQLSIPYAWARARRRIVHHTARIWWVQSR